MNQKALIGMSGGVDSSVAAYLTQRTGIKCIGATMKLYDAGDTACCSADNISDARAVAQRLGMEFHVLDFSAEFRKHVTDHFAESYESGLTPNPCIECNRHLKFSNFLDRALSLGCDYMVTGHYARIQKYGNSDRYLLRKAKDEAKDQSYFLYGIPQAHLSRVLFPLGDLTKAEVRQIADEQGFINAKKKDSQDICFIPDGDYLAFLKRHTGKEYPAGNYLDLSGNVIGQHGGAVGYTIGQRKGLGIALGAPAYVCSKDMEKNTVTLGPNEALFHTTLLANDWNWLAFSSLTEPMKLQAKARSRMVEQPATVYPEENDYVRVVFDEPQRALTPGQAVVLYDGDVVVGGGIIREIL